MTILDTCVAWWDLEEATAASRLDSYGSNTLSDNNSVVQATGKVGFAVGFTAGSTQYLTIADNAALSMGAAVATTVAFWVYFPSLFGMIPLGKGSGYSAAVAEYYFQTADNGGGDWRIDWKASDGSNLNGVRSSVSMSVDAWYFVVGTLSAAGALAISINNGTPSTSGAPITTGARDGTAAFSLGRYGQAGSPQYSTCRLDSVAIFKSVLSAPDLTTLYNSGAGVAYADVSSSGGSVGSGLLNSQKLNRLRLVG